MKRYRVTIDGFTYDVEIDDPRARPVTARLDGVVYTVDVVPSRTAADAVEGPPADESLPLVPATESGEAEGAPAPAAARAEHGVPAGSEGPRSEPAGIPPQPVDAPAPAAAEASPQTMTAPIPGVVASVVANVGQVVKRGDELLTLEAMKMFNVLRSPWAGTVTTLHVSKGEHVIQGQPLVTFGRR